MFALSCGAANRNYSAQPVLHESHMNVRLQRYVSNCRVVLTCNCCNKITALQLETWDPTRGLYICIPAHEKPSVCSVVNIIIIRLSCLEDPASLNKTVRTERIVHLSQPHFTSQLLQ